MPMGGENVPKYEYKPTSLMLPTSCYDSRRADFAVNFINMLKFTKGEWFGRQFHLLPWQETIVRDIFGIVDKETGYRQFRMAFIECPKKSGKSELAAAIALYLLLADGENGAEVYSVANDINQARIVFDTAQSMVEQNKDLMSVCKLLPSTKRINFPATNSFYRVISSEVKSKQGFNVSGLVFDEIFAQQTRELFDTIGLLPRRGGQSRVSATSCIARRVILSRERKSTPRFTPASLGSRTARTGATPKSGNGATRPLA